MKNYQHLLQEYGVDLSNYDNDKLWVDRLIVRGITYNGDIIKICRLKVTDDLKYTYKFYDNLPNNKDLETYEETYQRLSKQILDKENESINIIKDTLHKYPNHQVVLTTSMGKDSKLTEYLLNKVTNNYRIIFNNTTLDCADVYKEAKSIKDIEIVTPKMSNGKNRSFYRMIRLHGTPSRFSRWCCSYFKEWAINQYLKDQDNILFFMGIRNEESNTRSGYDWEYKNINWSNKTWIGCLPIRKWTELELWLYTIHNNISINPKYQKGYQRVGCHIACPYYTKSTWVLDKYWFPKAYNRFHNILQQDFEQGEKWTRLNCTCDEYHLNWNGGQLRKEPTEEVINEFMEYKGLESKDLALQYFDKRCESCNKKVYKKDEIAMNLKLFGRTINKFKCKKCLMKEMGWSNQEWDNYVKRFKQQECKLF